ncbi:MAG: FG-GAP-like repeat-containing protein [bacterium]
MPHKRCIVTAVALALALLAPVSAQELTFIPDMTFKGSSLEGWHIVGDAVWQAKGGELIGTAKPGTAGGWLVLDKSYQDIQVHASFRCSGDCRTGILVRMEKMPDGFRGVFASLNKDDLGVYNVTLDARGKEIKREDLRRAGGIVRVAPRPDPNQARRAGPGPSGFRRPAPPTNLPLQPPSTELRPGEWNIAEILMDANIVRVSVNGGYGPSGVTSDDGNEFGPIALFVGGAGEVRFKDLGYKDLAIKTTPIEQTGERFRAQRISDHYYAWSASSADFNRDGILDVVSGPYIYFGPDYTKRREIFYANAFSPTKEFSNCGGEFAFDFNQDGWPDVLIAPPRGMLYLNPKGESRRWEAFQVLDTMNGEVTELKDIDGDGRPELIFCNNNIVNYAKYDPANPGKPWAVHPVSEPGYGSFHGIGTGDINGDGRIDIVSAWGWWEQPPAGQEKWIYHPVGFCYYGRGGASMGVYDVNGDGLNDVVTILDAHRFGMAWFEQKRDANGAISFVRHMISGDFSAKNPGGVTFSQPHGSTFADVDGDGITDFIVGKRYFSHLDTFLDPDPHGPAVLYVYRTVRNPKAPGGAEFVPELVHNRSGAGSDVHARDLNNDGAMDIVTSTDRGTFIFWGKPRTGGARAASRARN